MTVILGISAFYHDSAAALLVDGELVAAVQQERCTRKKNDGSFPSAAIVSCLDIASIPRERIDYVAFYDKPILKFDRLIETYLAFAPRGYASFRRVMPVWMKEKIYQGHTIEKELSSISIHCPNPTLFLKHHESHAASAFYPSPFEEAAIVTVDGVGEWETTNIGFGSGKSIEMKKYLSFPHSLGLLYSAFTYYCGFEVNGGEYKLMGLAPFGTPQFSSIIFKHLINLKSDGSYRLNMDYFNFCQGLTMTNQAFHHLFGEAPRKPDGEMTPFYRDLAASVQVVVETVMLSIAQQAYELTGAKNLVLGGGVAFNCVANGKLLIEGPFENIWVQPAAGDAGGAVGAAYFTWHQLLEKPRKTNMDTQKGSLLGPEFKPSTIEKFLVGKRVKFHKYNKESELIEKVVKLLKNERVIGWFQGRAEFGARALGGRSILANPMSNLTQSQINLKIKFREGFRPFAPCVLREHAHEWFEVSPNADLPYMQFVVGVRPDKRLETPSEKSVSISKILDEKRSLIPAVTHVDYSARIQTVDERHGRLHRLLKAFYEDTECPILVNTSFNLSWDPIVNDLDDAYDCFMQSDLDVCVMGDFIILKDEQPVGIDYHSSDSAPWTDPLNNGELKETDGGLINPSTRKIYPIEGGIISLVASGSSPGEDDSFTEEIKNFYEENPFPNYEDIDDLRSLIDKARKGVFPFLLNEQIDYDASVLEVGCGTGQLTNYLSIAHRSVLGVDLCLNSLKLAQSFKERHGLSRATFAQMNLFQPGLKNQFFDTVISMGVLHHTEDCWLALDSIAKLVKPGGYLIWGLYNAFSRTIAHYPRMGLYKLTGMSSGFLDPRINKLGNLGRHSAWIKDQYEHRHESLHTYDQCLKWIDRSGFEFLNFIPRLDGQILDKKFSLFNPLDRGGVWDRILTQLKSVGEAYHDGGLFITIARKK